MNLRRLSIECLCSVYGGSVVVKLGCGLGLFVFLDRKSVV